MERSIVPMPNNFDSHKISVLIPSRNRNEILDTTLKSIFEAKSFCFEREIDVEIIDILNSFMTKKVVAVGVDFFLWKLSGCEEIYGNAENVNTFK